MSRRTLIMNRFAESILSEYESFTYEFKNIHQKYPLNGQNDPDVYQADFQWSWNGYSGFGKIDFFKSRMCVCNQPGEDESNMTVCTTSRRQQSNERSNCALYNDRLLEELFSKMLYDIDISTAISHDDYLKLLEKGIQNEN